jgi:hypothetical protein
MDGIRMDLREISWCCGVDSTGSGKRPVVGSFECSDEPSGSTATELVRNLLLKLALCSRWL